MRGTIETKEGATIIAAACSALCAELTDLASMYQLGKRYTWTRKKAPKATAVMFGVLMTLGGCGGAPAAQVDTAHAALDAVTAVVDPLYGAAVVGCNATEEIIVARPSTRERDESDIRSVREACNRAFSAFESVRHAQLAARVFVDIADKTSAPNDLQNAVTALMKLKTAADNARIAWSSAQAVLKGAKR